MYSSVIVYVQYCSVGWEICYHGRWRVCIMEQSLADIEPVLVVSAAVSVLVVSLGVLGGAGGDSVPNT